MQSMLSGKLPSNQEALNKRLKSDSVKFARFLFQKDGPILLRRLTGRYALKGSR